MFQKSRTIVEEPWVPYKKTPRIDWPWKSWNLWREEKHRYLWVCLKTGYPANPMVCYSVWFDITHFEAYYRTVYPNFSYTQSWYPISLWFTFGDILKWTSISCSEFPELDNHPASYWGYLHYFGNPRICPINISIYVIPIYPMILPYMNMIMLSQD